MAGPDDKKGKDTLVKKLATWANLIVVVVAVPVLGVYLKFVDSSLQRLELELKQKEEARQEAADDRDMRFKIYDAVTASLDSGKERREQVALALVSGMMRGDDPLRLQLFAVLQGAATDGKVVAEASTKLNEARQFATQQEDLAKPSVAASDWNSYNLDVFWCAANGAPAKTRAEQVIGALRQNQVKGRVRVRELPASINASAGYQIAGLVIRREAGEESAAASLAGFLKQSLPAFGEFASTVSRQGTPGYMSLFICQ